MEISDEDPRRRRVRSQEAAGNRRGRPGGPKAGEVLVEIMATGVCHTDAYTLDGLDRKACSLDPRPRGRGRRREVGPGVTSVKPGDHVIPLYTPECRAVQIVPLRQDQSLHRDPRDSGQGPDARRDRRFSYKGETDLPLHGLHDLLELHGAARDRAGQDPRGRAVQDKVCYIGCGVTTGVGAVVNTAKVEPGANVAVFGLGGIGLNVIQGARLVGADGSSASTSIRTARNGAAGSG